MKATTLQNILRGVREMQAIREGKMKPAGVTKMEGNSTAASQMAATKRSRNAVKR